MVWRWIRRKLQRRILRFRLDRAYEPIGVKIKGKILVIKRRGLLERERVARKLIMDHFSSIRPEKYKIRLSKRYPTIRGKRVEEYYHCPTIGSIQDRVKTRVMKQFLRKNNLSAEEAAKAISEIYDQIEKDFSFSKLYAKYPGVVFDISENNILVEKIDPNGAVHLILIDA